MLSRGVGGGELELQPPAAPSEASTGRHKLCQNAGDSFRLSKGIIIPPNRITVRPRDLRDQHRPATRVTCAGCAPCQARWEEAECWQPPPACATPSACSSPGAEFCNVCWAAWDAPAHEHDAAHRLRALDEAVAEATSRAEAAARAAESKRRKGGRPTLTSEQQQAKRQRQAARDAQRRPCAALPPISADRAARRDEWAREDAERATRGLRPIKHRGESHAAFDVRYAAWVAARTAGDVPGRCEGATRTGAQCRLHPRMRHTQAAPLRAGGRFCAHHEPDAAIAGVARCAATCPGKIR